MMRAIKIDPSNRTIEEIELAIDPNRNLSELRSIIGAEELELIPLDKGWTKVDVFELAAIRTWDCQPSRRGRSDNNPPLKPVMVSGYWVQKTVLFSTIRS